MIDQSFKLKLEAWTHPLVQFLVKNRVHPDALTWCGFFISSLSFFFTLQDQPLLSLAFWWSGRIFDGLDGMVARASGKQSFRGGFLDINLDMAAYSFVALAFLLRSQDYLIWGAILIGYVLCITSALSLGEIEKTQDKRSLRLASGLAEAGETGIFYSLMWLFPAQGKIWSWVWIGILAITIISRFFRAYKKGI